MFHERSIKNPGKKSWAQNDIVQGFWLHHTAYTNLTSNDNLGPFCSSFTFRLRNHHVKEETSTFKTSQKQQHHNQPFKTHTTQCFFCFGVLLVQKKRRNVTVGTKHVQPTDPQAAAGSCHLLCHKSRRPRGWPSRRIRTATVQRGDGGDFRLGLGPYPHLYPT